MRKKYLFVIMLAASFFQASAQTKEVVGVVTSAGNRDLLSGIIVWVKGSNQGLVTGSDGYFDLNVSEGDTIEVSSRFFKTKEIVVGSSWKYEVSLETNEASQLREEQVPYKTEKDENVLSVSEKTSRYGLKKQKWISGQ